MKRADAALAVQMYTCTAAAARLEKGIYDPVRQAPTGKTASIVSIVSTAY